MTTTFFTADVLQYIAISLMVIGVLFGIRFSYRDGWFFFVCPLMFCIMGALIFFTPTVQAKYEAKRLAAEKQQQEIEARNNRCIDDLSKRYNLSSETIKFLIDNGKLPCLPEN